MVLIKVLLLKSSVERSQELDQVDVSCRLSLFKMSLSRSNLPTRGRISSEAGTRISFMVDDANNDDEEDNDCYKADDDSNDEDDCRNYDMTTAMTTTSTTTAATTSKNSVGYNKAAFVKIFSTPSCKNFEHQRVSFKSKEKIFASRRDGFRKVYFDIKSSDDFCTFRNVLLFFRR